MQIKNIIKALEGDESLLLVLPKEVSMELDIADQDWLMYKDEWRACSQKSRGR